MKTDNIEIIKYQFAESMNSRNWSGHTVYSALYILDRFLSFIFERYGDIEFNEISRKTVDEFHGFLLNHKKKNGKNLKQRTVTSMILHLRRFFKYLVRDRIVLFDPTDHLRFRKEKERLPQKLLSISDMKRILDLPDISDPLEFRDKAILELFYSTGIRREELRNINVYDLDLENGFLKVKGKGKRERMVPVGKTACSWILKYLDKIRPEHVRDPKEQAFFLTRSGGRLCCELIAQIVKKYLNKAGLSGFSTHSIRHAFASHLIQNGCQVKYIQEMLGHSSLDTTKIYTHLRKEDQREALERSHPEGRGGRV